MGRKERRAEERRTRKEVLNDHASMIARGIVRREEQKQARYAKLEKNGITVKDLEENYKKGKHDALAWASEYYQPFFYSAIAIALHREFKFGETRMIRALETVQQIMTEEICTADIIERCRRETGLDIVGGGWCE